MHYKWACEGLKRIPGAISSPESCCLSNGSPTSHRSCEEFPPSRHITMLPHVPKRLPQAIQAQFTAQISATPTLQSPSHCFLISKRFRSSSLPPVAMTPLVARPLVVSGTVRFSAGPATDLNILLVSLSLSLCLLI